MQFSNEWSLLLFKTVTKREHGTQLRPVLKSRRGGKLQLSDSSKFRECSFCRLFFVTLPLTDIKRLSEYGLH